MIMKKLHDAGFETHILDAEELVKALDNSCDLPTGSNMDTFGDLMIQKYQEIPPQLFDDLEVMGIEQPILIEVIDGSYWHMEDGHHRLAWALAHKKSVPIVFSTDEVDPFELYNILADNSTDYDYA